MTSTLTLTPTPVRKVTATNTPTPKPTFTPTPAVPESFTLTLIFGEDTVCGGAPAEYKYDVSLSGDTITLLQMINGITTTGPYNAATGEFTSTASGLPGTETFMGSIKANYGPNGEIIIAMEGEYSYGNDPNYCSGNASSQSFFGKTEIVP